MTFKEWLLHCESCDKTFGFLVWDYELSDQVCPACNAPVDLYTPKQSKAPGIAPDGIPGGVEIRHLDRHPTKYYSRTEIKRRCNEVGMNWSDDTPKEYKIPWSGKKALEVLEK